MRFLCLHGMGTNADILETQTAAFRAQLPSHFLFEFAEGERPCRAAEGVDQVYPGPYLCWYDAPPSVAKVADAHKFVWEVVEEEGPFDAILGFSQGAALAASILLHHELSYPLESPPFRLAVFICGSLPFSIDASSGFDLSEVLQTFEDPLSGNIKDWRDLSTNCRCTAPENALSAEPSEERDLTSLIRQRRAASPSTESAVSSRRDFDDMDSEAEPSSVPITPFTPPDCEQSELDYFNRLSVSDAVFPGCRSPVRRFHPSIDSARIQLPTVHVFGRHDPYLSQSLELVKMCSPELAVELDHGGGHDIPRSEYVSKSIATAIEKAIRQSERMF